MKHIALHRSQTVSVSAVLLSLLCSATMACGQLQWSSYDTTGNLLNANVATGGDVASGSVTFTVPANTRMFFVTTNFTPIVLSSATASAVVTFQFSASGGITGVAQKTVEWGLYNSMGTASLADDMGMFGGWTGSTLEGLLHASGSADLFSGSSTGQGKSVTGAPTDGTTYTNQIRLYLKNAPIGVALGSSSSTLGAAGIAMNGTGMTGRLYTNPGTWTNTVNEFALMFNNTTANPVTVTLSEVALGNSVTWDASGVNPAVPTDGSGIWSSTNANWSAGAGGAVGASDDVWLPGYNAVIGANNGAAGTITITEPAGVTVSNITFNAAGSGSYTIAASNGAPMLLTGTPTITVASGVTATNAAQLGGTGFSKAGHGEFVLLPSVAATNVGPTTVNAGTLFMASTAVISLNDNVTVNSGATLLVPSSIGMNPASTLTINGGAVTNMGLGGTSTESHNLVVFDNNGTLAYGPTGSGQLNVTNFDFRSGLEAFPKFPSTFTNNFSVKSTAGSMAIQNRVNNSGANGQGVTLTVLAGTMILDYPNPAPNGDSTQGGQKLDQLTPLTLGGGTLFGRFNAAASRTEAVSSTIIQPGANSIWLTNNAANGTGAYAITLNALNRNVGGTVDFSVGGTSTGGKTLTTTTPNVNGILGGWATYGGTGWAVGSPIASLAATNYQASTDPTTWGTTSNVTLNASTSPDVPDGTSINSLQITAPATVTLGGALTLSSGGLLVTGSGGDTITGGTLEGASGADLIVHQYSAGDLTINSTLADNGSATALTKSGPGRLIIAGTDNMTGNNYLNGGTVSVNSLAGLAGGSLSMNNGTLSYTGPGETSSRSVILAGLGGTFDVEGSATLTQTTPIVSAGGATRTFNGVTLNLGDWAGLTKTGSGTLVLATNNIYNGPTVVSNGVLWVNGTNSLTGTSGGTNYSNGGTFTVYGGTLGGTGMISGAVDIKSGGTIAPGDDLGTLTLGSGLILESGSTSLFGEQNGSSGDLLQVNGNLTIQPNSSIAVNVLGSALVPTTNTIITYTGTKTGSFNSTVVVIGGSLNSSLTVDESTPGQIKLVAVPQVTITSQPQDLIVSTNDPATFTVGATGSQPIGYQWYFYGDSPTNTPVLEVNATNATFTIPSAQSSDTGLYSVVVSNNYNSVQSRFARLIVGDVCSSLSGPYDQTVIQGNNANFSTTVDLANPYPTFQWQTNGVNVDGATNTSLTLTNVQYAALNGTTVSVIASNAACLTTNSATLTVIVPPVITPQPTNLTVNVGDTAVFISGATGVPTPTFQWYKNNTVLTNQTNSTLTIANAQGSDIAKYLLVAANSAGSVTSSVVKLTVNSTTLVSTAFGPTNGATGICYDTPLYVTFNGPVSIVNSGQIRIYDSTNSTTPVDIIDMSSNFVVVSPTILVTNNIQPHSLFSGDSQLIYYFPVIVTGNTAAIYPHAGVLTSNQTYYVTMDNGIVADAGTGAYFSGVSATNAWTFTTKPTGPANPTNLVVATDNSGDFDTVQGAVDSVPPGNTTPTLINIQNGNYVEIVDISGKNNITFRGQSRAGAVVGYPNNNNLNGTTAARMAFKVNSSDITLENLTITNGTPQGGSQAEALLIYNNGLRCIADGCEIKSRQDTILINQNTSQGYFHNCEIYGNFDYIWGVGVGYFDHCSFHTLTNSLSSSYNLTAARTATSSSYSSTTPWVNPNGTTYSAYGFSFVDCSFDADPGVTGITLAGSNGTAGGLDSWVDCFFNTNAYVSPSTTLSNTYVFWQYSNTDLSGSTFISYTNVQTIGVTNNDPRLLAATNIVTWFSGWTPQSAPNITAQPIGLTVGAGQSAVFTVTAAGIPDPTYQWLKDSTNLVGQTSSMLSIGSASGLDIGTYSVVVANVAGSVTSSNAVLTVNPPTAPSAIVSPAVDNSGNVTFTINGAPGSAGFGYRVWATTNLSLTPITGAWTLLTNGIFDTGPVVFTDPASGLPQRFYLITVP
ncbi:MAG TPA: pectinesterase family protein [Verrucomicrobiae bacterium]|nr:pectinesterase family protein [Verrucomicrobiae bacterium]